MSNIKYYNRKIRILPVTMASLFLLLVAKVYDIYETGNQFSQLFLSSQAIAKDNNTTNTKTDKQSSDDINSKTTSQQPETFDIVKDGDSTESDIENKKEFSEFEVTLLQSLSKRRKEIEQMEKEVRMKESLLEATDLRLEEKINEIKNLEKVVRDLLTTYDKEEEAKVKSLVKIYENMKPKEAARIFNELDMSILLMVVDKMAERRAAPILAKMSPLKAKNLTEELAEDRKLRTLQEDKLNQIAPAQPAP